MHSVKLRKITVLAGGVGAARFISGLAKVVGQENISVIGNVGDDVELLGIRVSPDLDIVAYTLAGLVDESKGWGFSGDTFKALEQLRAYGADVWMMLGDRDLATHIFRSALLREGAKLSEVTAMISRRLGVRARILPATDDKLTTMVELADGRVVSFEEYYVRYGFKPRIRAVYYRGCSSARPAEGVIDEILDSDAVVFAPSNPVASIMPIICIKEIRETIRNKKRVAAISPIAGGKAFKGPADAMMRDLGLSPSPLGVAQLYRGLVKLLIIDAVDKDFSDRIRKLGLETYVTDTRMDSIDRREQLARETIHALNTLFT